MFTWLHKSAPNSTRHSNNRSVIHDFNLSKQIHQWNSVVTLQKKMSWYIINRTISPISRKHNDNSCYCGLINVIHAWISHLVHQLSNNRKTTKSCTLFMNKNDKKNKNKKLKWTYEKNCLSLSVNEILIWQSFVAVSAYTTYFDEP